MEQNNKNDRQLLQEFLVKFKENQEKLSKISKIAKEEKEKNDDFLIKFEDIKAKNKKLENENVSLRSSYNMIKIRCETLQKTIEQLNAPQNSIFSYFTSSGFKEENKKLNDKLKALEAELEAKIKENENCRTLCREIKEQNEELKSQIKQKILDIEEIQRIKNNRIDDIMLEKVGLEKQLKIYIEKEYRNKNEIDSLNLKLLEYKTNVFNMEKEIKKLGEKIQDINNVKDIIDNKIIWNLYSDVNKTSSEKTVLSLSWIYTFLHNLFYIIQIFEGLDLIFESRSNNYVLIYRIMLCSLRKELDLNSLFCINTIILVVKKLVEGIKSYLDSDVIASNDFLGPFLSGLMIFLESIYDNLSKAFCFDYDYQSKSISFDQKSTNIELKTNEKYYENFVYDKFPEDKKVNTKEIDYDNFIEITDKLIDNLKDENIKSNLMKIKENFISNVLYFKEKNKVILTQIYEESEKTLNFLSENFEKKHMIKRKKSTKNNGKNDNMNELDNSQYNDLGQFIGINISDYIKISNESEPKEIISAITSKENALRNGQNYINKTSITNEFPQQKSSKFSLQILSSPKTITQINNIKTNNTTININTNEKLLTLEAENETLKIELTEERDKKDKMKKKVGVLINEYEKKIMNLNGIIEKFREKSCGNCKEIIEK